jgi:hypothetical protein
MERRQVTRLAKQEQYKGRALQTDAAIKVSAPVAAVSVTPAAALDDLDGYRGALGMLA